MKIPDGATVVLWCSMFCTGNPASGEVTVEEYPDGKIVIPICDECKEKLEQRLDKRLGPVIE